MKRVVGRASVPAAFGGKGFQPVCRPGKMPVPPRTFQNSVLDLIDAIDAYLEEPNQEPKPFLWTKTADEILEKLAPI